MKFLTLALLSSTLLAPAAKQEPTLAEPQQSVLTEETTAAPTVVVQKDGCACNHDVEYRNKRNIAPCAVSKTVEVCLCETCCDGCKLVTKSNVVGVDICVPPCECSENVKVRRHGKTAIYDYGRYEVVVSVDRDNDITVNYRKRLFNL